MIILIDAEKKFLKIQPLFIIRTVNKLEIERNLLNHIKHVYEKLTARTPGWLSWLSVCLWLRS